MRCLAIHFTVEKEDLPSFNNEKKLLVKNKHIHTDKHSMENCRDCEYRRQIAVLDTLPESVVQGTFGWRLILIKSIFVVQ